MKGVNYSTARKIDQCKRFMWAGCQQETVELCETTVTHTRARAFTQTNTHKYKIAVMETNMVIFLEKM